LFLYFALFFPRPQILKTRRETVNPFLVAKELEGQVRQDPGTLAQIPNTIVRVNRRSNYYLRSELMMWEKNASSLISMKH
jgi:hypothetical protein